MAKKTNKSPKTKSNKKPPVRKVKTTASKKVVKTPVTPVVEKQKTTPVSARSSRISKESTPVELPFGKMNYILLIVGVVIIALGFLLMSMDDFVDATQFSVSLYIAPVVVVAGFLEIIYAIMYSPKKQATEDASAE